MILDYLGCYGKQKAASRLLWSFVTCSILQRGARFFEYHELSSKHFVDNKRQFCYLQSTSFLDSIVHKFLLSELVNHPLIAPSSSLLAMIDYQLFLPREILKGYLTGAYLTGELYTISLTLYTLHLPSSLPREMPLIISLGQALLKRNAPFA